MVLLQWSGIRGKKVPCFVHLQESLTLLDLHLFIWYTILSKANDRKVLQISVMNLTIYRWCSPADWWYWDLSSQPSNQ